jgi:DNA-binding response OmpR family regulator
LYCLAAAALVLAAFFFFRKSKKNETVAQVSNTQNEESSKEGLLQIGNYVFNPGQQWLELNKEKTTLTVKESKLLQIFANAPNTVIERDALQKEVWENEGVIVTRSLDMFISKLRKKLSNDPGIKIVNVHGKGYRLEVNG